MEVHRLKKKLDQLKKDSNQCVDEYLRLRRLSGFINYSGVRCEINIEEIEENVRWFWGRYGRVEVNGKSMDMIKVEYINQSYYIPFNDEEKLKETQKIMRAAAKNRAFTDKELRVLYYSLKNTLNNPKYHQMHVDINEILRIHF